MNPPNRLILLVPEAGLNSNTGSQLLAEWEKNKKGLLQASETPGQLDLSEQLFDILATWEDLLVRDAPYFSENHRPEEPGL